jgi:hypothetical protein
MPLKSSEFYAGDAYFCHSEVYGEVPYSPFGLRLYQSLMDEDRLAARLRTRAGLRELSKNPNVTVFCAHDIRELEALRDPLPVRLSPAEDSFPAQPAPGVAATGVTFGRM